MSWEDVLKQKKFNFDDLKFKAIEKSDAFVYDGKKGMTDLVARWTTTYDFGEDITFKIVAGPYTYSTPKGFLEDPMGYETYEVMLDHPKINRPQEIGIMEKNWWSPTRQKMVFRYKTKEEITEYAGKVEANLPSKLKQNKQKKNLGRLVDAFRE